MKKYYSVEDIQKILLKDRETVLRYIRNGIIKDPTMVAAFQEYGIIAPADIENNIAYLNYEELLSIQEHNFTPATSDDEATKAYKKRLKSAYIALLLENPKSKPYKITSESLLLLLQRKFGKNLDEAQAILNHYDNIQKPTVEPVSVAPSLSTPISTPHRHTPADVCRICEAFKQPHIKEIFIKGLYLLQIADGEISPEEAAMIEDRAIRLGITSQEIKAWIPNPLALEQAAVVPQIKFESMTQSIVFILEAIRLAYQDDKYTEEEKRLIRRFAANNKINEELLLKFEAEIEKEHAENILQEWKDWQK